MKSAKTAAQTGFGHGRHVSVRDYRQLLRRGTGIVTEFRACGWGASKPESRQFWPRLILAECGLLAKWPWPESQQQLPHWATYSGHSDSAQTHTDHSARTTRTVLERQLSGPWNALREKCWCFVIKKV